MPRSVEYANQRSMPIAPQEAHDARALKFPDKAIDIFNELIKENYYEGKAKFDARTVNERLVETGVSWEEVRYIDFWLVDEIFTAAGWIVALEDVGGEDVYRPQYTFTAAATK